MYVTRKNLGSFALNVWQSWRYDWPRHNRAASGVIGYHHHNNKRIFPISCVPQTPYPAQNRDENGPPPRYRYVPIVPASQSTHRPKNERSSNWQGSNKLRRMKALARPLSCRQQRCRHAARPFSEHARKTTKSFLALAEISARFHTTQRLRHNRLFCPQRRPLDLQHPNPRGSFPITYPVRRWHPQAVPADKAPKQDLTGLAKKQGPIRAHGATNFRRPDISQCGPPVRQASESLRHRTGRV